MAVVFKKWVFLKETADKVTQTGGALCHRDVRAGLDVEPIGGGPRQGDVRLRPVEAITKVIGDVRVDGLTF